MGPGLSAVAAAVLTALLAASALARLAFLGVSGLALSIRSEWAPGARELGVPVPTGDRDAAQAVARPTEAKRPRESRVASQGLLEAPGNLRLRRAALHQTVDACRGKP